jgi:hypothetical protein
MSSLKDVLSDSKFEIYVRSELIINQNDTSSEHHRMRLFSPRIYVMVRSDVKLYRKIWEDRNTFLHGTTKKESEVKERERLHNQVRQLHSNPPKFP